MDCCLEKEENPKKQYTLMENATEGNRTTYKTRDPFLREPVITQHFVC